MAGAGSDSNIVGFRAVLRGVCVRPSIGALVGVGAVVAGVLAAGVSAAADRARLSDVALEVVGREELCANDSTHPACATEAWTDLCSALEDRLVEAPERLKRRPRSRTGVDDVAAAAVERPFRPDWVAHASRLIHAASCVDHARFHDDDAVSDDVPRRDELREMREANRALDVLQSRFNAVLIAEARSVSASAADARHQVSFLSHLAEAGADEIVRVDGEEVPLEELIDDLCQGGVLSVESVARAMERFEDRFAGVPAAASKRHQAEAAAHRAGVETMDALQALDACRSWVDRGLVWPEPASRREPAGTPNAGLRVDGGSASASLLAPGARSALQDARASLPAGGSTAVGEDRRERDCDTQADDLAQAERSYELTDPNGGPPATRTLAAGIGRLRRVQQLERAQRDLLRSCPREVSDAATWSREYRRVTAEIVGLVDPDLGRLLDAHLSRAYPLDDN